MTLLDLARLRARDFPIELAPVDLVELVRAAGEAWAPRAETGGVDRRLEVPAELLVAVTDTGRIRLILDGRADNALRVAGPGAPVVFALRREESDGAAELQVRDGGPGLTPEDCEVAFEPSAVYDRYRGTRRVGPGSGWRWRAVWRRGSVPRRPPAGRLRAARRSRSGCRAEGRSGPSAERVGLPWRAC